MQDYELCFGFLEKASRAPSAEYLPKLPEKNPLLCNLPNPHAIGNHFRGEVPDMGTV